MQREDNWKCGRHHEREQRMLLKFKSCPSCLTESASHSTFSDFTDFDIQLWEETSAARSTEIHLLNEGLSCWATDKSHTQRRHWRDKTWTMTHLRYSMLKMSFVDVIVNGTPEVEVRLWILRLFGNRLIMFSRMICRWWFWSNRLQSMQRDLSRRELDSISSRDQDFSIRSDTSSSRLGFQWQRLLTLNSNRLSSWFKAVVMETENRVTYSL